MENRKFEGKFFLRSESYFLMSASLALEYFSKFDLTVWKTIRENFSVSIHLNIFLIPVFTRHNFSKIRKNRQLSRYLVASSEKLTQTIYKKVQTVCTERMGLERNKREREGILRRIQMRLTLKWTVIIFNFSRKNFKTWLNISPSYSRFLAWYKHFCIFYYMVFASP